MTNRKVYRLTNDYSLSVMLRDKRGRRHTIYFGGFDVYARVKGAYSTTEKIIQDALEASPLFGKKYILEKEYVRAHKYTPKDLEEKTLVDDGYTFSNLADCKDFLMEKFDDCKSYMIQSRAKCIEFGKEHGLTIIFDN